MKKSVTFEEFERMVKNSLDASRAAITFKARRCEVTTAHLAAIVRAARKHSGLSCSGAFAGSVVEMVGQDTITVNRSYKHHAQPHLLAWMIWPKGGTVTETSLGEVDVNSLGDDGW